MSGADAQPRVARAAAPAARGSCPGTSSTRAPPAGRAGAPAPATSRRRRAGPRSGSRLAVSGVGTQISTASACARARSGRSPRIFGSTAAQPLGAGCPRCRTRRPRSRRPSRRIDVDRDDVARRPRRTRPPAAARRSRDRSPRRTCARSRIATVDTCTGHVRARYPLRSRVDRARRGASGALYPQSALAGLNPLPRGTGPRSAPRARRRWSGP